MTAIWVVACFGALGAIMLAAIVEAFYAASPPPAPIARTLGVVGRRNP